MAAGRSYSDHYGTEKNHIVLNEAAVAAAGLKNPVGKTIHLWGEDRQIIGVTKDFHFQSLHEKVKPCFFRSRDRRKGFEDHGAAGPGDSEGTEKTGGASSAGDGAPFHRPRRRYRHLSSEQRLAMCVKIFSAMAILFLSRAFSVSAAFEVPATAPKIGSSESPGPSRTMIFEALAPVREIEKAGFYFFMQRLEMKIFGYADNLPVFAPEMNWFFPTGFLRPAAATAASFSTM